jgi:hypothetical protein
MSLAKLYLTLAFGLSLRVVCAAAAELTAAELETLQAMQQGGVVILQDFWAQQRALPALPVKIADAGGPQFLLSDKPEYFYSGDGIAMQEEVKPGAVRLYVYHVPQPGAGPKTISAVIQNLGDKTMELRFLRYAFPPPGKDYHKIGKRGLIDFFNSKPEPSTRRILPGARAVLDPHLDATTATTDQLVHAFYEFEISQPARVTVFQRDPGQSSVEAIDTLPKLPRVTPGHKADGAGRGIFLSSDFKVACADGFTLDTTNGPMRLSLADGRNDKYIRGRDSIAGLEPVTNSGNYGVMYHIHLKWRSSDGRSLALLMTRPGGNGRYCAGQAGAVQVNEGIWQGGTVAIPADRIFYGDPGEMVIIQKFPPPPKGETGEIEVLYSPPGASCIPTPMVFAPY